MDEIFMIFLFILIGAPILLGMIDFIAVLFKRKTVNTVFWQTIYSLLLLIAFPVLYLFIHGTTNECCSDSAVLSPGHGDSILILMVLGVVAYFISLYRKEQFPPLLEVTLYVFQMIGVSLSVVMLFHAQEFFLFFVIPIVAIQVKQLLLNHYDFVHSLDTTKEYSIVEKWMVDILRSPVWVKFSVLTLLILPVLLFISSFLMLFGQKPDAMIQAFTQTYTHGLSQLDYECKDVVCPGDCYVATVGAKGGRNIVRVERMGVRQGRAIVCSRQLLVANAFEQLLEKHTPIFHTFFRKQYNKLGSFIMKHSSFFGNRIVATMLFLLIKPVEWVFLLTLYCYDKNPENRINAQYMSPEYIAKIKLQQS